MRRTLVRFLGVLAVLAAGCVPGQAEPGPAAATTVPVAPTTTLAPSGPGGGSFKVTCTYSHRRTDDPIVHANMPGMAHSHDFFGNRGTGAASTGESLVAGTTSCDRSEDRSAYWIPTASYDGVATTPQKVVVYYVGRAGRTEQPIPAGLEVVAGSAAATAPQDTTIVAWRCSPVGGVTQAWVATPPTCPSSSTLNLRVKFPNCWDGRRLDSPDHTSHLSTDVHGACDPAHPVNLPIVVAEYYLPNPQSAAVSLASGAWWTLHGDFFNGWDQATLTRLVRDCVNAGITCGGA